MYLIDIGNRRTKIVVYKENQLVLIKTMVSDNFTTFWLWANQSGLTKKEVYLAIVKYEWEKKLQIKLPDNWKIISANNNYFNINDYLHPKELGIDRIFTGLGAWKIWSKSSIVIDAGTCCTLDYINEKGSFCGGIIMPGLNMMKASIRQYCPNLPYPTKIIPHEFPGKSSLSGISLGTMGSFILAIKSWISLYQKKYQPQIVVITGGDSDFILKHIDQITHHEPYLLFWGLLSLLGKNTNTNTTIKKD